MITDKYNSEKAVSLRKKLQNYTEQINELKYNLFCLTKEAIDVEKEYSDFLGYCDLRDASVTKGGKDG